jgi:hypothetical protein
MEAACEFAQESHRHPLFLEKRTYSTDPEHCPVQCLEVIMEYACDIPLARALETEPLMDGDRISELVGIPNITRQYAVLVLARLSGSRDCCLRMAEPTANVPEGLLLRLLGIISTARGSYATEMLRVKSAEVVKNVTEALSM